LCAHFSLAADDAIFILQRHHSRRQLMKLARTAVVLVAVCALGCASSSNSRPQTEGLRDHPQVRISGVDGTVFRGELMNGSVTIDSGQGQLTLLTDHINQIDISPMADVIDSPSVKIGGKLRETSFMLRSEHGVFTLAKDRLKKIEFHAPPAPEGAALAAERTSSQGTRAVVISP
jgi:hypothetical protein